MRKHREEDYMAGNLVAMIDVVFQIIIFFVCTTNLQDKSFDDTIHLATAPNGAEVKQRDPREINIDVSAKGTISIARTPISAGVLRAIVTKARSEYGEVPVVIRGDGGAKHEAIQTAMNACMEAGVYKLKFAAYKEKGK